MRRVALLALLLVVPSLAPHATASSPTDAARAALDWLARNRHADGTWDASTAYVLELVASLGVDPHEWPDPTHPISAAIATIPGTPGSDFGYKTAERYAEAAAAAGIDPRSLRDASGNDPISAIQAGFKGAQFGDPTTINDDAWAILALRAAGTPPNDPSLRAAAIAILGARDADGGWTAGATPGTTSDTDFTGMALVALADVGQLPSDTRALAFLESMYDATSGGYGDKGFGVNPDSTAWALQGLAAYGVAPRSSTIDYLLRLQDADGGFPYGIEAIATTDAATYLGGGRFPLAAYANGTVSVSVAPARSPTALRVEGPFASADWTFDGGEAHGLAVSFVFPSAGAHRWSVVARGQGVAFATNGTILVPSAPPVAALAPAQTQTLRGATVSLDATPSSDADGRVVEYRIDWGDGNASRSTSGALAHAYAWPGDYAATLVVVDDAGATSAPATALVRVLDRAPAFASLPARLVADRAHDATLAPAVTDPDGDAVSLAWTVGNASGSGIFSHRFDALGNFTLALRASDPFGASAWANVSVEVVDLPPQILSVTLPANATAGAPFAYAANATDLDGPAPQLRWRFGNETREGANGTIALPAGETTVVVEATDTEGALVRAERTLVVGPADEPASAPQPVAPRIDGFAATFDGGVLRVAATVSPPDAEATVAWSSDAGAGNATLREGRFELPLPDATSVSVTLLARVGDLVATQDAGPLRSARASPSLAAPGLRAPDAVDVGANVTIVLALPADAIEARLDFGDGTDPGWSTAPNATHAWSRPGSYGLRVDARAADGRTSSATAKITVRAPVHPPPAAPVAVAASPRLPAPANLTPQEALAARKSPGPSPALALAAVATLAAALRARARKARR